jgi:hypothetical protein
MVTTSKESHDDSFHLTEYYKPLIVIPTIVLLLGVVSAIYAFYLRYKQKKREDEKRRYIYKFL